MQAAKKAVETIKETAANIGASAKSGLEKTRATVQEKVFFYILPLQIIIIIIMQSMFVIIGIGIA